MTMAEKREPASADGGPAPSAARLDVLACMSLLLLLRPAHAQTLWDLL
jgi:hypothetical protein